MCTHFPGGGHRYPLHRRRRPKLQHRDQEPLPGVRQRHFPTAPVDVHLVRRHYRDLRLTVQPLSTDHFLSDLSAGSFKLPSTSSQFATKSTSSTSRLSSVPRPTLHS
jgi:hypothetical protein